MKLDISLHGHVVCVRPVSRKIRNSKVNKPQNSSYSSSLKKTRGLCNWSPLLFNCSIVHISLQWQHHAPLSLSLGHDRKRRGEDLYHLFFSLFHQILRFTLQFAPEVSFLFLTFLSLFSLPLFKVILMGSHGGRSDPHRG